MNEEEWILASKYAKNKKLIIFADIFGEKSFEVAKKISVDGYKIHSEDLLNTYFIKKVAIENKILILGVGGAHRIEIYRTLQFLKKYNLCNKIILMPGVQVFPTPIEAHSLDEISDLVLKYEDKGIKVGFADHISGDMKESQIVPLMALAKGASIIEKHFTLNRNHKWEDYESALDEVNLKLFQETVCNLSSLLKKVTKLSEYEKQYRDMFKKTPVLSEQGVKNKKLNENDLNFSKFENVKVPLMSLDIVNKRIVKSLQKDSILRASNLNEVEQQL